MTAAVWPIIVPLAGAAVAVLAGRRALAPVGIATAGATLGASLWTASTVWGGGAFRHPIGGWGAPLGIDLVADGLAAGMLLMAGGAGAGISLYAAAYFADHEEAAPARSFWPLWLFLWASLNAVFLSGDVFNLYVALELLSLSGAGLVVLSGERRALVSAVRYLLAAFLGSMAYLLGVAILYAAYGTLDLTNLAARVEPGAPAATALAFMTTGLVVKTALFPVHFWLPRAHASAVSPASAILSALVVKASFYITLRLWWDVFAPTVDVAAAQLVGALGAGGVLWGGIQAARQHHFKLLVAYSTVSQIGYLFLLVPLAFPVGATAAWRDVAWTGGVFHALSHAFAKASMFLAAGAMIRAAGSERVTGIRGVAARLPIAVFAFGLAGLSVIGLPPSGGFVAKWLLLHASVHSGQWWWTLVILGGGLLSAGYIFLVLGQTLTPPTDPIPAGPVIPHRHVLELSCLALALIGFALGLRATEPLELLRIGGGGA